MKNLISVVVPVYNVKKYLNRCIDSLLNQTYKNIEIILIDDGSTDGSSTICDMYEKQDKRIRVFHNKNHGVSFSRNYGIKNSNGYYIMFVDSDDFIDNDYIKIMYDKIRYNYNVVVTNHLLDYGIKKERNQVPEELNCSCDISFPNFIYLFFNSYLLSSSCKMLIEKKIITKNKICFNEKMKYGEDMLFCFNVYVHSKKTYYVDNFGYHYFIHNSSSSHSNDVEKKIKYCYDNYDLYIFIIKYLDDNKIDYNEYLFLDAILNNLNSALNIIISISKKEKIYENIIEIYNLYTVFLCKFSRRKSKLKKYIRLEINLLKNNVHLYIFIIKIKCMMKGLIK